MDLITAELAASCAALGFDRGDNYVLDSHSLDIIKDLIKYLKRDDDSHTVRQYLGRAKLLETDLKKIFVQYYNKTELWDVLLRLLINLTSPALMVYNEELPAEKTVRSTYEQLVVYLHGYKVALADEQVWAVVAKRLKSILNMEPVERGEENVLTIERILTLIRNVLQVPPNDNEIRADNDATVHDEVLFALHASGFVDMLLFITSNVAEQQYHIQVLEIIALMLREQCPAKLATVGLERSGLEKDRDAAKLRAIREREVQERMEKIRKYAGSRHSRFGGTFVVQNMKAIGENQLICHKPYQKIEALEFSQEKVKLKKSKKKLPAVDSNNERTSALSVRLFLKEFCVEFLNGAYNSVMRYARFCINSGGNTSIAADASCYLWTMRFFMEFNRHYKFQVKYVSETISTEIFHLVQTQMEHYNEMMIVDKKKIPLWAKRLHLAVKAYQELLHTLAAMDNCKDQDIKDSSQIIKSNVFYVPEYRETILFQLLHYDDVKMSRTYLIDLLTTAHIFVKMLQDFCKRSRTVLVGKNKVKRSRARPKKKKKQAEASQAISTPVKSLEDVWDEAAPEISAVMREGTIPEISPFDVTLDIPLEEQKGEAMKKIQILLRKKEIERAIGMLRSSRQVWPENDCFGKLDIPPEEEFLALREIFFADLGIDIDYGNEEPRGEAARDNKEDDQGEEEEEEDYEDEEEEEEENRAATVEETNFNFDEFLKRFAHVKVVKAMSHLLAQFHENNEQVNHYVVKMLHRIAFECNMYGMIFQASIFRTFQRILDSKSSKHKELQKFAIYIIRKFAEVAERNPKAYMELLFWKSSREVTEMVDGYDIAPSNEKASRSAWSEAEEDELRTLFMEHQTNNYPKDLIDWLLDNLINENRTRRGIIKKLKELSLIVNSKSIKSAIQKRLPKEWSEQEIAELTEIWNRVREDQDPVGTICDALTIKRSKKAVKDKLLETGLAGDRKELRKKRRRERDGPKMSWEAPSASERSESSDSDDSTSSIHRAKITQQKVVKANVKPKKRKPTHFYTDGQLAGLLKDVINNNLASGLKWLKESLEEIVEDEDRDESDSVDVPLVPVSEDSMTAMDSPKFQRLLRALGIEPPADEQESYWRVPFTMSISTIKKRCDLIENILSSPQDTSLSVTNIYEVSESDGDDEELPVTSIDKPTIPETDAIEQSNFDFDEEAKRDRSQDSDEDIPVVKKRRVIVSEDEEDDKEDSTNRNEEAEKNDSPQKVNGSSRRRLISDDEDDEN